ncbi:MAG: endonuclease/exonuclease/phosphatase family protein [Bacteroidaceae bacterium]|nr:endonuclease/exonuclease/phosphatase family protein [Bacteroidaceae bacterium]
MKRYFFLAAAIMATLFGYAQSTVLDGLTRITDLSQIEEGESYYIVSDRVKFNYESGGDGGTDGNSTFVKAMSNYQNGYSATNWDSPGSNKYFVYYGDLNPDSQGFVWKAEKVGDKWAFLNMELNKYLGNHNPGETDLRFSDTAIGYTLTKLPTHDGSYGFSFTNDSYLNDYPGNPYINVHQYPLRKSRGVLALADWSDANATDADQYGYPGRWRIYKAEGYEPPVVPSNPDLMGLLRITDLSELVEGEEYFIVSDRTAYASNNTGKPKAMSTLQSGYTVNWGEQYVYWGDIDTTQDGFVWTIEETPGGMWAFKNKANGRYLGNMNTGETDVVFSDTPVGYTLTDLIEGFGKFSFTNSESEFSLHVQGYLRSGRPNNSLAKQEVGKDDYSSDVATNGYPGRWHIYVKGTDKVTDASDITEGKTYYIVSDRTKYAGNNTGKPKAMSTLQNGYTVNWGSQYVYWGDLDRCAEGYQWTAEKVGGHWAFKNKENGKYLGEKNTSPVENDVVFSNTPISYTLTASDDGSGKFSFVHAGTGLLLNVQGYGISRFDNSLMLASDNLPADADANGYPSRWHLYATNTIATQPTPAYDKYHFDTITVMSYNIQHCAGSDGVLNVQRTADAIKLQNPTIVALQEVDRHFSDRSNNEDQVQLLSEATGMYGRFGTADINCGNAVLSKEKPLSTKVIPINDRNMLVTEMQDYVFACIHVGLTIQARKDALAAIRNEAKTWESVGKPFIVAGDFNDDGTEGEMQGVWGLLCDSLAKDFTFHSDRTTPTYYTGGYVIDHIISYNAIGGVKNLGYQVIDDKVTSDHLPIVARLRVGFPKKLTTAEARALVQDSVANNHSTIDMTEMDFDDNVTASDLQAEGNVIVYVPDASPITGTNIVNNGVCTNLIITDGHPFGASKSFVATTATYTRNVTSRFGTICLPFPVSSDANVQYYTLDRVEGETLYLTEQDEIQAGVPAVFENLAGTITANGSNVTVHGTTVAPVSGELKLLGTFRSLAITDPAELAKSYYISKDQFHQATNSLTVNPFRAYFTYTAASASKVYDIAASDDVTAVSALTGKDTEVEAIYSVDGEKLLSLQRGVNIIQYSDGKTQKIIVR